MVITNEVRAAVQEAAEQILDLWWIHDATAARRSKQAVLELVIMSKLAGVKEAL